MNFGKQQSVKIIICENKLLQITQKSSFTKKKKELQFFLVILIIITMSTDYFRINLYYFSQYLEEF